MAQLCAPADALPLRGRVPSGLRPSARLSAALAPKRLMLRQARGADIPGMHRVRLEVRENKLRSAVVTEADYLPFLETHGRGWVVEEKGEVVGFAIGDARDGNIWALFVHPKHEGRGFGRQLHDAMVSWLWSRGLKELWLTTEPGTRAQEFYEAAGWQSAGKTPQGVLRFENCAPTRRSSGRPPATRSGSLARKLARRR